METAAKKYSSNNDLKKLIGAKELSTITPKHPNTMSLNYNTIISACASGSDSRKPSKTPIKTPLRLSSTKKKTPNTLTNDRYIPNRTTSNMEASYHLLVSGKDQENIKNDHSLDNIKRKLINDTFQCSTSDKTKVLNLHKKQPEPDQIFAENMKILYNGSLPNGSAKKNQTRYIQTTPEKILDAPEFIDDFYLNLIDWSSSNNLSVALNRDLYIWNASTKDISQLFAMDENSSDYVSSISWIQKGNIIGVGNSKNIVEIWDVNKKVCLRQMKSHRSRIGSLAWNAHLLSSGSRSGEIHQHDVRVAQHHVGTLKLHTQEICGLKWSADGRYLASGANDNLVCIWDSSMTSLNPTLTNHETQPLHVLRDHTAAVKAVSWCPWQHNLLATGGGTSDRQIKIWNMHNGSLIQSHDTLSQISAILWSKSYKELITSHGHGQNQLTIWKYPDMIKVSDLLGHTNRVLGMAISPDEESVVSVSADETLRFWKCFALDDKTKKSKDSLNDRKTNSQAGLSRCIR